MEELLRRDIGYSGPIFVDEIEMLAFSPHSSIYDGAIESIRSGADVLLVGHSFETQRRLIDELILVSCPANN